MSSQRLERERKTLRAMIAIFCGDRHGGQGAAVLEGAVRAPDLCASCSELHAYAMARLDKCPFGNEKPTCADCPVHCYKPEMRERVREVMRYAGPRMLQKHPVMALLHLWDGALKKPARPLRPKK